MPIHTEPAFLIGLIADKNPSAIAVLSALAIHRHNPKIAEVVTAGG